MHQQESRICDFRGTEVAPLLLIIDRRDNPATPLPNRWTYQIYNYHQQIIVHKPIGIEDCKVDLSIEKLPINQEEVVLLSKQDAFLKANMYENFGDIGKNIKWTVDEFQQLAKSNQNIRTIADRAKFIDNYPEYRKMHGNVSKHVTLATETIKIVEE